MNLVDKALDWGWMVAIGLAGWAISFVRGTRTDLDALKLDVHVNFVKKADLNTVKEEILEHMDKNFNLLMELQGIKKSRK